MKIKKQVENKYVFERQKERNHLDGWQRDKNHK
jgi:hypothetical protein